MLVFLVRHAHADPGDPDELRPLSDLGRGEAHALGKRLAAHPTPPRLVLTSPLLRARETADAISRPTGAAVRVEPRLAPGATADALRKVVAGESGPVAAVCHQPDGSQIALALTGADPGFAPGGTVEIELEA